MLYGVPLIKTSPMESLSHVIYLSHSGSDDPCSPFVWTHASESDSRSFRRSPGGCRVGRTRYRAQRVDVCAVSAPDASEVSRVASTGRLPCFRVMIVASSSRGATRSQADSRGGQPTLTPREAGLRAFLRLPSNEHA